MAPDEIRDPNQSARDIERLWMIRVLTGICSISLTLGYLWLQNQYNETVRQRMDIMALQSAFAALTSRQADSRDSYRQQEEALTAIRQEMGRIRAELEKARQARP